jgi:hypothetical protein
LLAFFPHADGRHWVLWTPQGYYDCSPGGEDLIGWHLNRGNDKTADFFPVSRYREQFYRPDVIDHVLETRDVAEALRLADEAAHKKPSSIGNTAAAVIQKQPPVVELAVGGPTRKLEVAPSVRTVTVRYKVWSGSEPAKQIRVTIDGRPALVEAPVPKDADTVAAVDVPVPSYNCSISVLAENDFAASKPAVLQVSRAGGEERPKTETAKPRLFVLSVGVDANQRDGKDVNPIVKNDAEDMVKLFTKQSPALYRDVQSRLLTGPDATSAHILEGFDWLRQKTEPDSVVIIILMGHGENEGGKFHFVAYDQDTSVGYDEIQRCLSALPGRVLLFVGSCHSGSTAGRSREEEWAAMDATPLANALSSEENGVVVFTAATGRQVAWSVSELRNSLFFTAVLEGLSGKADLLHKGRITVASLETYVASRVPELFEKYLANSQSPKEDGMSTQTPTVAKPQTIPDFVIATTSAHKRQ